MVAPSTTIIDGALAIRVAIVNHRTGEAEIETLVEQVLLGGRAITQNSVISHPVKAEESAEWTPRRIREARLRDLEAGRQPSKQRFERACLLAEMGRTLRGSPRLSRLLSKEPAHRLALNNLGTLLHDTGYRTAARTAYAEAVTRHPDDPMSRVNLANTLRESDEPG